MPGPADPLARFRRCTRCGYDLHGCEGTTTCPECGEAIDAEACIVVGSPAEAQRQQAQPWGAVVAAVFAVASGLQWVVDREGAWFLAAIVFLICTLVLGGVHWWRVKANSVGELFQSRGGRVLIAERGVAVLGLRRVEWVAWPEVEEARVETVYHHVRSQGRVRAVERRRLLVWGQGSRPRFRRPWKIRDDDPPLVMLTFDAADDEARALSDFIDRCRADAADATDAAQA